VRLLLQRYIEGSCLWSRHDRAETGRTSSALEPRDLLEIQPASLGGSIGTFDDRFQAACTWLPDSHESRRDGALDGSQSGVPSRVSR